MIESVKFTNLLSYLKNMNRVAVAFSGGVDSSLLVKASQMALHNQILAISVKTPYIPEWEMEEAIAFTKKHNIPHKIFELPFLVQLRENPRDRCYVCKTHLFKFMMEEARKENFDILVDGTNFDDLQDYRPGLRALKELEIKSPFLELKITKAEIRRFSQLLELPTWEKPAYACLLTRVPYGQEIKNGELKKIEQSELFLHQLGFRGCRVRIHENLARIEIRQEDFSHISAPDVFNTINRKLKAFGFSFVTLDMEGYRMGSHNESL